MSVRFVLLAVLSKRPNTGYGIGRLLRNELSHVWQARLQQIYRELARAEAEGLVAAQTTHLPNRPAKKLYSLTDAGLAALDAWLAEPSRPGAGRDDLLVRLYCLPRAPRDLLVRRLEERRESLVRRARELQARLDEAVERDDESAVGLVLTLEASLATLEAQRAWCERARARLTGAPGHQAISAAGAASVRARRGGAPP
jgi:DNA-binding PadR family transcriptional regulator